MRDPLVGPTFAKSWSVMSFKTFICVIFSFLTVVAQASAASQIPCEALFERVTPEGVIKTATPGRRYLVQFKDHPTIKELTFEKWGMIDEECFLQFESTDGTGLRQCIKESDIADWTDARRATRQDNSLIEIVTFAVGVKAKVRFKPFRRLAKLSEDVEVVGDWTSSKESGQKIAKRLEAYDRWMTSMGFEKPNFTRVYVAGRMAVPFSGGPACLRRGLKNLWSKKRAASVIVMSGVGRNTKPIEDESILYHERTHSLLQFSYPESAYVNSSKFIQEAVADFSAAHMLNSPEIAAGVLVEGQALRDIKERVASDIGYSTTRRAPLDIRGGLAYHEDSLLVSHILWQWREQMGAESVNRHFKELIDHLNLYRGSYELLLQDESRVSSLERQIYVYDLEYFLATFLKVSESWETSEQVESFINENAEELKFSMKRIKAVAEDLKPLSLIDHDEEFLFRAIKASHD